MNFLPRPVRRRAFAVLVSILGITGAKSLTCADDLSPAPRETSVAQAAPVTASEVEPTTLQEAVRSGHPEAIILHLRANHDDLNEVDGDGDTALHVAVRMGLRPVVELLLAAGADVNTMNSAGLTPLKIAEGFGRTEIAKILRKQSAETNPLSGSTRVVAADSTDHHAALAESLRDLLREADSENGDAGPWVLPVSYARPIAPMPTATRPLPQGINELRLENPNSCHVSVGIRRGEWGRNLWVRAGQSVTTRLPAGTYQVYFIFANQTDQLLKGDSLRFVHNGPRYEQTTLTLNVTPNGNYKVHPVAE